MSDGLTARRRQLREFLRDARARVDPQGAGFPRGRRRVPGLRRSEVAELAGFSETWYARFESGHARLSLRALNRLAQALRLDSLERRELHRLAIPELGETPYSLGHHAARELRALRYFMSRAEAASSASELTLRALETMRSGIPGIRLASSLERTAAGTWLHRSDRPDIEAIVNAAPVDDALVRLARFVVVPNVIMIGSTDYRHVDHLYAHGVTRRTELRSGFGVQLPVSDRFIGCAFGSPGAAPTVEQTLLLQTVAATIALTGRSEPPA